MTAPLDPSHETVNRDNWLEFAECRNMDPDYFFPVGNTGPALEQIEKAIAVCRTCLAQTVCLEYALKTNQDNGIWGGTTEEERRQIRKNMKAGSRSA
jgi:WhiB family redox-sensing transcriptional regulator